MLTFQTPELEKHAQYDSDLESLPSLSSWASRPSSYDPWEPYPLPEFPDDVSILEWRVISRGFHGEIRRVRARRNREAVYAVKLFTEESKGAYERERDAFALMIHRGVKRCIPRISYQAVWPRWKWDGEQPDDYEFVNRDEILYGLVMEYFENCREIDMKTVDLHTAEMLGETLKLIHEGGVVHRHIEERNILLVRESGKTRIAWVGFSYSWSGKAYQSSGPPEWDMFRRFLLDNMVLQSLHAELLTW